MRRTLASKLAKGDAHKKSELRFSAGFLCIDYGAPRKRRRLSATNPANHPLASLLAKGDECYRFTSTVVGL
jgi:hypothetical protein